MADAAKAVSDYFGGGERIVYVNVMNRISIDCDCNGNPAEPDIHDIGVAASTDPVALDRACLAWYWPPLATRLSALDWRIGMASVHCRVRQRLD